MDMVANLSSRQKMIAGLTVATAIIHLVLAAMLGGSFAILFALNGLGYLALLAAYYFMPQFAEQRSMVRWAFLGFTAVTFVLYFVFNWPAVWGPVGVVDKLIELAMMVLLWQDA